MEWQSREEVKREEPRVKESGKAVKVRNSKLCLPHSFQRTGKPWGQGCQTPQVQEPQHYLCRS